MERRPRFFRFRRVAGARVENPLPFLGELQFRTRARPILNLIPAAPPLRRPLEIPERRRPLPLANQQQPRRTRLQGELDPRHTYYVKFTYRYRISETIGTYHGTIYSFRGTRAELDEQVNDVIQGDFGMENFELLEEPVITIEDLTTRQELQYNASVMRLREYAPMDVVNLFDNTILLSETEDNCVKTFLRERYPDIAKQKKDPIGKLGNEHGVSTDEIQAFCEKYKIPMIAFNPYGECIARNILDADIKTKYKKLVFLAYHNHIYEVKGKELHFAKVRETIQSQYLTSEDLQTKFNELIKDQHRHPRNVLLNTHDDQVRSFEDGETLYFHNPFYLDCKTILEAFSLEHLLQPASGYMEVFEILMKYYQAEPLKSFFPIEHAKGALHYQSPVEPASTKTIDKNKCYADSLRELPFLLTTDIRHNHIKTEDIHLLRPDAIYVATPEYNNVLMQKQDNYAGEHLIYCRKEGFKFTIQERILCKSKHNVFAQLIPQLYERFPEHTHGRLFKDFINQIIGLFQLIPKVRHRSVNAMVVSKDEIDPKDDNYWFSYGDRYIQYESDKYVGSVYNHKPIAIQIKDRTTRLLYEKMRSLKLHMSQVVQISTDSITIDASAVKSLKVEGKGLKGWKYGAYRIQKPTDNIHSKIVSMRKLSKNNNTLITGNAGNGKSYDIENRLIPELEAKSETYLIVSSKHSAIVQHRNNKRNAEVIQKYEFSKQTPTEQHIIVEECGIISRTQWDLLYKWTLLGKTITAYGDFRQLPPVDDHTFNGNAWLDLMFGTQLTKNENHRNDFTPEYYQDILDGKYDLLGEVRKHSTPTPEEAEVVVAHTNAVVHKYNVRMAQHYGVACEFIDDEGHLASVDTGVLLLCKTNDLRSQGIYNNMLVMSDEIDEADLQCFKLAYARTIYNLQGDAVDSYYLAPEDEKYFSRDSRFAYTLISRLKTK